MPAIVRSPRHAPTEGQPSGRVRAPDHPDDESVEQTPDGLAPEMADHAPNRARDDRRPARSFDRIGDRPGPDSIAEWFTLGISSLIVLGIIGLTSYFYLTGSNAPAVLEVEPRLAETYQAAERYYLPVTVRNSGGQTGEEVRVRVAVTDATGRQESAEFQILFLAGGGSSQAVVSFASDPRQGRVEAGVMSYLEP